MALGDDVYQVLLRGTLLGVEWENVFYFKKTNALGVAIDLTSVFTNDLLPLIRQVASPDTTFAEVITRSINDETDFFTSLPNLLGTAGGNTTSAFMAWGFRLLPNLLNIRAGGKRFCGVAGTDIDDGEDSGAIHPRLLVLAAKLGSSLVGGLSNYQPHIYSRVATAIPDVYFERYVRIVAAEFRGLTSQNTRKS